MSLEKQVMSTDRYPSIISPQMEALVFIILQNVFAIRALLKIGEYLTTIHWKPPKLRRGVVLVYTNTVR